MGGADAGEDAEGGVGGVLRGEGEHEAGEEVFAGEEPLEGFAFGAFDAAEAGEGGAEVVEDGEADDEVGVGGGDGVGVFEEVGDVAFG